MTALADAVRGVTGGNGTLNLSQIIEAVGGMPMPIPRITKTSADTSSALGPNTLYVWPEMASLAITLAAPADLSIVNEYHFIFTSGATATTLSIPATVNQPDGFTGEANHVYEVSILENCMTAQGWAVTP